MNALNAALLKLTGMVLAPFAHLPSQIALIVLSIVAGVLAALAFRYTSPQTQLKRIADQVRASLLAMRLFKDDLRSVFAAQGALFKASALRLIYSLPPMVVLIVPFVLLLAQLAMWYEFSPLKPGDTMLVEVEISPQTWETHRDLQLVAPNGIEASVPVRDGGAKMITWRIKTKTTPNGDEQISLGFRLGGDEIAHKQLVVSDGSGSDRLLFVSPMRAGTSFWDRLLYPGEPAFNSASPIQSIKVRYAARENTLFGMKIHWLVTFFVVSILGALAAKPFVKVQF